MFEIVGFLLFGAVVFGAGYFVVKKINAGIDTAFESDTAKKGLMRGQVAIPIRDEKGQLHGYIGIQEAVLPPDFKL